MKFSNFQIFLKGFPHFLGEISAALLLCVRGENALNSHFYRETAKMEQASEEGKLKPTRANRREWNLKICWNKACNKQWRRTTRRRWNFCVTMTSFNRHFSLNCFHPDNCIINNINGQQETWYRINVEIVCIENRFRESAFLLAISHQPAPAAQTIDSLRPLTHLLCTDELLSYRETHFCSFTAISREITVKITILTVILTI